MLYFVFCVFLGWTVHVAPARGTVQHVAIPAALHDQAAATGRLKSVFLK